MGITINQITHFRLGYHTYYYPAVGCRDASWPWRRCRTIEAMNTQPHNRTSRSSSRTGDWIGYIGSETIGCSVCDSGTVEESGMIHSLDWGRGRHNDGEEEVIG